MAQVNLTNNYIEWQGDNHEYGISRKYSSTLPTSDYSSALRQYIPAYTKFSKVVVYMRIGLSSDTTGSCSITIGGTQVASGTLTNTRTSYMSGDVKSYFQSGTANAGLANSEVKFTGTSKIWTGCKCWYAWYIQWYPIWKLTVNGGTGGGEYNMGSTATIEATVPAGHKFVKWSDGNTNKKRTVTVSANATYTAQFEKIPYVSYDSIFSFKRWKDYGIGSGNGMTISDVSDVGFTGTATIDDAYTTECRPIIPVENGKTYTFECDTSGGSFEFFIFNCNSSGSWSNFTYGNTNKFNFTASTDYVSIRCDVVGTGTVVNFSNFRIYPADCPYMSNSVLAVERTDVAAWSMPTPTRDGYIFKGWNTALDGSKTAYTSSSAFPADDTVLYSQWESAKINKIYIDTLQPKEIYFGTALVKEIYIDQIKVYG